MDIRYSIRVLLKNRSFSIVAILGLALGIGVNTAMFSVVHAVLLKPLPYREPDRLVWVTEYSKRFKEEAVNGPDFVDWRAQSRSFDTLAAFLSFDQTVSNLDDPVEIRTSMSSESIGRLFGVRPALGHDFSPQDLSPHSGAQVALISDHYYRSRYGGSPVALGQALVLNGVPYTIIGVLPAGFRLPLPSREGPPVETEAILPFGVSPGERRPDVPMLSVQVMGRLRPGVALETARAELETIRAGLPPGPFPLSERTLLMVPLRDYILGNTGRALLLLLGAVGFVLLIACANVANLLLGRAASRQRETAVRLALGATRGNLVRLLLTESLVLAFAGGAAGLLLGTWSIRLLVNWSPVIVPRLKDTGMNLTVLAFVLGVSVLTGLVFGMAPAISGSRASAAGVSRSRGRLRGLLIVSEVALALVLLTGAGLMVKSLWQMHVSSSGVAPDRVLISGLQIQNPRFQHRAEQAEFLSGFVARVESLPGVRAAAVYRGGGLGVLRVEGRPRPTGENAVSVTHIRVTPHYFQAAGVRLLKGRLFTSEDRAGAVAVVVVNEVTARHLAPNFPRENPVGVQLRFGPNDPPATVVGVVGGFRSAKLDADVQPEIYFPAAASFMRTGFGVDWGRAANLMVRASSDPTALIGAIRAQGREISGIALLAPETLAERLNASVAPRRFQMTLLLAFALLAVLLAVIGIYGVVSYTVTQRTRELGIRVALGAQRGQVVRVVLVDGLRLVAVGIILGLGASFALTRFMALFLYGVRATDFFTYAAVSILLLAVGGVAAWLPARRAASVDPTIALRYE